MPGTQLPQNCIFTTKTPIGFVPMGVLLYLSELKQFAHRDIQHPCNAKDHIQRDRTVTVLDAGHMGAAYVDLVRQLNLRQPSRLAVVGVVIPYSADGWSIVVNTDYVLKSVPSVNSDDVVWSARVINCTVIMATVTGSLSQTTTLTYTVGYPNPIRNLTGAPYNKMQKASGTFCMNNLRGVSKYDILNIPLRR